MFNILLCDAELRLYELESLRVGLNLAKFGTRKTLESHSKSIMQMDRSHQSTLLPLCYMILYIRYMLSPECLSAYCLLLWSTAGHAASGTGLQCLINFYGSIDSIHMSNSHGFHAILVEFIITIFDFVAAISSYKQVEGLQDINQSVEILVRLLSAVPGWSEKMFRYFIVLNL
ncbi:hypothetical protein FF1_030600 [Malus domestica]